MISLFFLGAAEGGLFDFDATLPLMAVQVVALTFILNSLFFKPVGKVVEEREGFILSSKTEAKAQLAEIKNLENALKVQLKEARKAAQDILNEAENDSSNLYKEAVALANAEANASREETRSKIDKEKESALNQLKLDSEKLSDLIVQRLLSS